MWLYILGGLMAGTLISIGYLTSRFARFSILHKVSKGKNFIRLGIAFVLVMLMIVFLGMFFGMINAEICILHLVAIWIICDIIGRFAEKKSRKKFTRYYAGMAALGITFVYLSCGWYLAHHVWRTEYMLETEKKVGNLRIVAFADSHVGNTFSGEEFMKHVKAMQSENPDLVVIAGDFVDDDSGREDMIAACKALGTLKTTYGVYYVFGNHDKGYYNPEYRGYSLEDLKTELLKNNIKILEDETRLLDDRFYLVGRADRSENLRNNPRASMEELTLELDAEKYCIVVDHQPYEYDEQQAAGADLVISGHTHGGQLFPLNPIGELSGIDAKRYGLEKRDNTNFIVTSGISDWAIKFKTGCKSEYVVVDVKEIIPYNNK